MGADLLGIAITGLKTSQAQISTTGHNITNANQEGYSRQNVDVGTNPGVFSGAGYVGTGVNIQSIERISNEFLTQQIRLDTTTFNELDVFSQKVGEIDNLLSNEAVGLSGGLSSFFKSFQAATDDPTSIPVRQLVLAQSGVLAQRFSSLHGRLEETNDILNQELGATAGQISSLSSGIANLNKSIVSAVAKGAGNPPNDLLDARDEAIRELSELVSVSTFTQPDGAVNVFIGNGQPLVVGQVATRVEAVSGQSDPSRQDIAFVNEGSTQIITDQIKGGRLGGLLDFRNDVLDRSFNELGRIALSVVEAMNHQQSIGLDLNGNFGVPLFDDINLPQATLDRVVPNKNNNLPADRVVSVEITDATVLGNSDYTLSLAGSGPDSFELKRNSDDTVVLAGGLPAQRPTSIEFEGFSINLQQGTFQDGDSFQIMPTRLAARDVAVTATSPEVLAFALPITTSNNLANTGTGKISQGDVLQTRDPATGELMPAFAQPGSLSPPLMIRFTSETTYDVLDVSDPANPKSLDPPFEGKTFIPGQTNEIFPAQPGETVVVSDGFNSGRIPEAAEIVSGPIGVVAPNTYENEQITITYTDPKTGVVSSQPPLVIDAGDSAEEIAFQMTSRDGVSATGFTETQIRVVDNGGTGLYDFNLFLNGVNLKNELAIHLSPQPVPEPMSNDDIAAAINSSSALQKQKISAVSDGDSIRISAATGADLKFEVQGDADGDFVEVKGDEYPRLMGTQRVDNGVDLSVGSPNSFQIDLFDGPGRHSNPKTIEIEGVFTTSEELASYLKNQIDLAYDVPGKVAVEVQEDGTVQFLNNNNDPQAKIQLSNVVGSDPLGLAAAVSQGIMKPDDILTLEGATPVPDFPEIDGTFVLSPGIDLDAGGPNSFDIDIYDGTNGASNPITVNLTGDYTGDPAGLLSYVQSQVDTAVGGAGKVSVSVSNTGTLRFTNLSDDLNSKIEIASVTGADPLGLATADAAGVVNRPVNPTDQVNAITIAGEVTVTLSEDYSVTSNATRQGNVFTPEPEAKSNFFGYNFDISGNPDSGDEFYVNFNTDGVSDNRNALKFVEIESQQLIGGNKSFQESYGDLVEYVGTVTSEAKINRDASQEILAQSTELRNSISGVNLDEEAANLIRYELSYNAASRVVSVARDLFNTLLQAF